MSEVDKEAGCTSGYGTPECAICLQPFDDSVIIPRVLFCGHSLCECCISTLSQGSDTKKPSFLRCPECNQPSKLLPQGNAFPKNIELLRFIKTGRDSPKGRDDRPTQALRAYAPWQLPTVVYEASRSEFFRWIIPQSCAEISNPPLGHVFLSREDESLQQMLPVTFVHVKNANTKSRAGDYFHRVWNCLELMPKCEADDIIRLLTVPAGVLGIWMDVGNRIYLVCNQLMHDLPVIQASLSSSDCAPELGMSDKDSNSQGFSKVWNDFMKNAMDVCEIFMDLHNHNTIAGLVTPKCLGYTEFLHIRLDITALIKARKALQLRLKNDDLGVSLSIMDEISLEDYPIHFTSPELLARLKKSCATANVFISCKADSWTLGCLLSHLLFGSTPWDGLELEEFLQKCANNKQHSEIWIKEKRPKGNYFHAELSAALLKCFSFMPQDRPCVSEIWYLIQRESNVNLPLCVGRDARGCCKSGSGLFGTIWCLVLGGSLKISTETVTKKDNRSLNTQAENDISPVTHKESNIPEEKGCSEMQCDNVLNGHMDHITSLAVCGQHLLSASFDKTIRIWSLKDGVLVKTLKGHSQRVTSVVPDQQLSLCISGDYGGELCVWEVESDAVAYVAKWYHHQDWRYSGVASLVLSSDRLLYSGGGDKVIKVWSLQGYDFVTMMEGHKSVVSSLLIDGEILYSGSWDGSIRLWLRKDHSPLAVLGESSEMSAVRSLEYSDGLLLAGLQNGTIQIWRDELCVNTISAHDGVVSSLVLHADTLYSGSWDFNVKAWKISELLDNLTSKVVRSLHSAVTSLACYQDKIYVGLAAQTIHVIMDIHKPL